MVVRLMMEDVCSKNDTQVQKLVLGKLTKTYATKWKLHLRIFDYSFKFLKSFSEP